MRRSAWAAQRACYGGGQAGEPHALDCIVVTEDVSKPDTSWLKALAPENTAREHSQAQPRAREISISTDSVMPTVRMEGRAHAEEKQPAS